MARWRDGPMAPWRDGALAVDNAVAQLVVANAGTGDWRDLMLDAALLQLAVAPGPVLLAAAASGAAGGAGGSMGWRQGCEQGCEQGGAQGCEQGCKQGCKRGSRHRSKRRSKQPPLRRGGAGMASRPLADVQRYRARVEARFREQPTLAVLAGAPGITPTQLNRVCHQVLGHCALGVRHGSLVLQAQRDPACTQAHTALAVKQIAAGLGFADAGYFSRFFLRQKGQTPTAWRAQVAR